MLPVSFYGLKVPPGGILVSANPGVPANIHITMASIDPTEDAEDGDDKPFVTLKIIRNPLDVLDDEDDEDDEIDEDDVEAIRRRLGLTDSDEEDEDFDEEDDEDEDEEMVNGGPSDPDRVRKAREAAFQKSLKDGDDEDLDLDAVLVNGINGKFNKGKARALGLEDDDTDESIDLENSSFVVCTLDVTKNLQQTLDLTLQDEEVVYFRVFGNRSIHLTGNFVIREHSHDSDDEEEDEDGDLLEDGGLYGPDGMYDSEDSDLEIDELDDIAEPRIMELDDEPPMLIKVGKGKGKGKRAAGDLDSDEVDAVLDKLLDVKEAKEVKEAKAEPKSKHQAKKLKNNEGQAIAGSKVTNGEVKNEVKKDAKKDVKKDAKKDVKEKSVATPVEKKAVNGNAKKVQFAEKLEQGPTPSAPASKRVIKGVTIDDRKPGSGQAAKKGDKVAMRYIGKLKDGKMFDANKKGKPFTFKLGTGEVIKGGDIGVDGMRVGGERRIIVPSNLAYGSKSMPGIPGNSELTFDIKMLSIS